MRLTYCLLAAQIGEGYHNAKSRYLFRDFVDATAQVTISQSQITVRFQERAHNPLLIAGGFGKIDVPVSWLGGKHLRLVLG